MPDEKKIKVAVIVPCYNEEAGLERTFKTLYAEFDDLIRKGRISEQSVLCFVDDGSKDKTWELIRRFHAERKALGMKLSRNFGHQYAMLAGMLSLKDDFNCVITIDADLQDDVSVIGQFVDKYLEGFEIVYGVRKKRNADSIFKRMAAQSYYRFLGWMGVDVVYNHADFRLVGSRALRALAEYPEVNLFLRGMFPLIGFNSTIIYYDRSSRVAGKTKYTLAKMFSLALHGITSFSIKPLRAIAAMGVVVFMFSVVMSIWVLISNFLGKTVQGWSSILFAVFFLGGMQMISLGIIGEYIGKLYGETKKRPRYIIEDFLK